MAYKVPTHNPAAGVVAPSSWGDHVNDDLTALNTAFRIDLLMQNSIAPTVGINAAAYSEANSATADTLKPMMCAVSYDPDTDEGRVWVGRVPRLFGGNPVLKGSFYISGAQPVTVEYAKMVCLVSAVSDGDKQNDNNFDSENSALIDTHFGAAPAGARNSKEFEITLTNNDSMAADDFLCIMLYRDADDGGDDATGEFILTSLSLEYTLEA